MNLDCNNIVEEAEVYSSINNIVNRKCGVYIITQNKTRRGAILYIGCTSCLKKRLSDTSHPYYRAVKKFGIDYVSIRFVPILEDKFFFERVLIAENTPIYNLSVPKNIVLNTAVVYKFKTFVKVKMIKDTDFLYDLYLKYRTAKVDYGKIESMILFDCQTLFHYDKLDFISNALNIPINQLTINE